MRSHICHLKAAEHRPRQPTAVVKPSILSGSGLAAKPCLPLETPGTAARQTPLSMGFPRQGYSSGLPFPPPGDLPDPGTKPMCPALWVDSLLLSHQGIFCLK